MEASFWSGLMLENFMFNHINIRSYPEFIGVCFITAAIALAFEGSRTVRDWLYLEFLKKRSCNRTSSDAPIVLQNFKALSHKGGGNDEGSGSRNGESVNNGLTKLESNGKENMDSKNASENTAAVPVIATGTIHGSGKNCDRPSIYIGLFELSFSTLLHMFQVILGYILMLMVMTFNIWIFLAVLVGTTVGFFVFDAFNKKIHALKTSPTTASN